MRKWLYKLKNKGVLDTICNISDEEKQQVKPDQKLTHSLTENIVRIKTLSHNSQDINVRSLKIDNIDVSFVVVENMVNLETPTKSIVELIKTFNNDKTKVADPEKIYDFVESKMMFGHDVKDIYEFDMLFEILMSGFLLVMIDGVDKAIAIGAQGFAFRSISEATNEVNERGAKEGFTEPIKVNTTMIRRRVRSQHLKFEFMTMGEISKTNVCLVYMSNVVSNKLLNILKQKLKAIKLDTLLSAGYLAPFLESPRASFFSDVGITERPDVMVGKIMEGRVGILVDGTPFALVVPYLFSENFQSMDDYCEKSYYATSIRILKYFSFVLAILLPGLYVAIGTFHPELFPSKLLFNIAAAQEVTPFSLMIGSLIIHVIYEIMREAGLRLPRAVGHAVSIVGALVVGDAAVTAGLIGSPMVLIVALTAISSFVVPSLHEAISVLRFVFIIIGGFFGLYGIALFGGMLLVNASALNSLGTAYLSPISPFNLYAMRDTFVRASFKTLEKKQVNIENFPKKD